ncbi:Fanconi anemia protein FANCD2, partial [Baffinella frigidus]
MISIGDEKAKQEVEKVSFIRESIQQHSDALKPYFAHFLAFADSFTRSSDYTVAAFGGRLYEVLFSVFSDDFSRSEIIHNVVAHTGSGSDSEVGAALDALLGLVHSHNSALRQCTIYVKTVLDYLSHQKHKHIHKLFTVLDYLSHLKHKHIRKLFTVLSELSVSTQVNGAGEDDARLDDDVHIHIRKLLSNPRLKHIQHGVIGAVSAVMALSSSTSGNPAQLSQEKDSMESSCSQRQRATHSRAGQAIALLDTLKANCEGSEDAHIFLLDELGSALSVAESDARPVSESTLSWIKENLTWEIEDRFLEDVPEGEDPWEDISGMHPTLKAKCAFNLDGDEAQ